MALLEVKDLCKSFGTNDVLRGVSFKVEKGEVLSVIGSSGSGKTTMLRCLNFLETPTKGSITVGDDVLFSSDSNVRKSDSEIQKIRLHFGLVFQQFNLFPQYNVITNIMLAPKLKAKRENYGGRPKVVVCSEIQSKAENLLEKVGLSDKASAYPCELSGGQQQRVAIARALALEPDILCFDEPTSALDPELTGEVLKVIRGLKSSDSTMIVVTHEMEFARNVSDHIIYMADGIIEEEGTPEVIFEHPQSEKTRSFLRNSLEKI